MCRAKKKDSRQYTSKNSEYGSPVCTELLKGEFLLEQKAKLYAGKEKSVEGFFEQNSDLYEVVAKDFLEYVLDVSVNEFSVHWCGSSTQKFNPNAPFLSFQKAFLIYNAEYTNNLAKVISAKCPENLHFTVLKEMVQADLTFINGKLVKPVTSREVLNDFMDRMKTEVESKPELHIFSEEHLEKYLPKVDFHYQDNLLVYFNGKESIPESCQEGMICFYEICAPELDTEDILTRAHKKFEHGS